MHTQKKDREYAKTKRVTVRMTETLYDVLETYAEKAGMTPVAYIRNLIVSKTPTVRYEIVYYSPVLPDTAHRNRQKWAKKQPRTGNLTILNDNIKERRCA